MVLWLVAGAAGATVRKADALWSRGDYRGAFAYAIEPAQHGNAHAQFLLGEAYRLGRSVEPDLATAEDWYSSAARGGDIAAATELGLLHVREHQPADAVEWLTIAAREGEPRALCALAALYYYGDGVRRDQPMAFALMARAADMGLPDGRARLATLRAMLPTEVQPQADALALAQAANLPRTPKSAARATIPSGAIRIQIGAFPSAAAAERGWGLLTAKRADTGTVDHAIIHVGRHYLLQASLSDRHSARNFSRSLTVLHWQHFTLGGPAIRA